MNLHIHSDASYLSESKAHSHLGRHFYLITRPHDLDKSPISTHMLTPNNESIKSNSTVMKMVSASAAEAEFGAVFFNMEYDVSMHKTLE